VEAHAGAGIAPLHRAHALRCSVYRGDMTLVAVKPAEEPLASGSPAALTIKGGRDWWRSGDDFAARRCNDPKPC
jgi:hypothetical protein